jgi:hypothetical protein
MKNQPKLTKNRPKLNGKGPKHTLILDVFKITKI